MKPCPFDQCALHVVFSFAQADRSPDLRLGARLLMCSQRELRSSFDRLARLGLVDRATGAITREGMLVTARLRMGLLHSRRDEDNGTARAA